MRLVTNLIHSILTKKKRWFKKVLDKWFNLRYNEPIKSEEWFLAHSLMENIMQWIKATDGQPKLYQPVLCVLENKGDNTRYPLMCFMNVHNEWLDMHSNKIDERKVTVCYWAAIQDWPLDNVVPCSARDEDIDL